jgi:hypothetical protein
MNELIKYNRINSTNMFNILKPIDLDKSNSDNSDNSDISKISNKSIHTNLTSISAENIMQLDIIKEENENSEMLNEDINSVQTDDVKKELLLKKTYYKTLLHDYKEFEKEFVAPNSEQTIDNLYKNIKTIKKELYLVKKNFNLPLVILDGENILKSIKIQKLLKSHILEEEFSSLFSHWKYGSSDGYVQPLCSLSMTLENKIKLINFNKN